MKKNILTEKIWLTFSDRLRSFILARVRDESAAADILQEAFIRIHANIDTLEDETRVQAWVYQITRNLIADHFRRLRSAGRETETILHEDEDEPGEVMSEAIRDMVEMMDDLPREYCDALCRTELEGMSQKEYASMNNISYSAAKSRVQRARKKLRDMLMKCCHYQFDTYGTVVGIYPANCCCCGDDHP